MLQFALMLLVGTAHESYSYALSAVPTQCPPYNHALSLGRRVVHNLATDHGHQRLDVLDLVGWHREIITVEHQEIGILAARERAEVALLEQEAGIRARMRDQRLLARDGLPIDLASADHLAGHGEAQGVERVRGRDRGRIRAQSPMNAEILDAAERRHVPCLVAVHLVHQRALDERPAVDLR